MKIVEAEFPKSKAEEVREICEIICDKQKAYQVEFESEKKYFDKVARRSGYKVKTRIRQKGGWDIWVRK